MARPRTIGPFVSMVLGKHIRRATEHTNLALHSAVRTGIVVGPNTNTLVTLIIGIRVDQKIRVSMETPLRGSMRDHFPMDPAEVRVILDSFPSCYWCNV